MKHSAALKVKAGDLLAAHHKKDGVLWEVMAIKFPGFVITEAGVNSKPATIEYSYFHRPTKAQLNAYKKRKEKCNERRN